MATIQSNHVSYDAEFNTLVQDELERVAGELLSASNGAVQMLTTRTRGDFERRSKFSIDTGKVKHRDDNDLTPVAADTIGQYEESSVKTKKYIKVGTTDDAFLTNGYDQTDAVGLMADEWAKIKPVSMVDDAIAAGVAAMTSNSDPDNGVVNISGRTIDHLGLNQTLARFGDRYSQVVAWVMHSASMFGLGDNVLENVKFQTTDLMIAAGTVGTLGKPVIVVDSPSLQVVGPPGQFNVLGLSADSLVLTQSAPDNILIDKKQEGGNITTEFGVNTEYLVGVKGYAWQAGGGRNPNAAAIAAAANWAQVAPQNKTTAGVMLTHNAA